VSRRILFCGAFCAVLLPGCDRNIEPYDPTEQVEKPDLSRIFPEGAERAARQGGGMPGAEAAGQAPARGEGPRGAPPPSSAGAPLSGTVRVAPELVDRLPGGAVLFLIARTAQAGPPTAVKRIGDPSFPLEFTLGPDDRMIQAMPFDGPFTLSARMDVDGHAMTREPGDLQGESSGSHTPGTEGIEIVIDEAL